MMIRPLQKKKKSNMKSIAVATIKPSHQGIVLCMDKVYEEYFY